jgi:thiol:disulfide interchange protein DsbD
MKTPFVYLLAAGCLSAAVSGGCSDGSGRAQNGATVRLGATAGSSHPASWSIEPVAGPVSAGKTASVRITARIQDGWHVYSLTQAAGGPKRTQIVVPPGQPFVLAGTPAPTTPPEIKYDSVFGMSVQEHERAVTFTVPVRATRRVSAPADSIRVEVKYQICDARLCFPQQTSRLAAAIIAGSDAAGE